MGALEAVDRYNRGWARSSTPGQAQLPIIEEIRWCLVSGGVYRHGDASKVDVAKATLHGMMSAACGDLRVPFAYDDNCFLQAYNGDLHKEELAKAGMDKAAKDGKAGKQAKTRSAERAAGWGDNKTRESGTW